MAVAVTVAQAAAITACATLPVTPVEHASFHDLGEVDGEVLDQAVSEVVVDERGYVLARRNVQFATLYYETDWRERDPLADEEARGATAARTRLVFRGQRTGSGLYRTTLEGENEIRTDSVPAWHSAPVTAGFREGMAELVDELTLRIDEPDEERDP